MAIIDVLASSSGKKVPRNTLLASLIYKMELVKLNGNKLKEGDKVLFINTSYKTFSGSIEKINKEIKSKKNYCKIYDVTASIRGKNVECNCVYFGYSGKVCIEKHKKYELFDDLYEETVD